MGIEGTSSISPWREWKTAGGERWSRYHPLYQAVIEYYLFADDNADRRHKRAARLIDDFVSGRDQPLPGMVGRMLEIDREQRGNGAPDANIASLAALLTPH